MDKISPYLWFDGQAEEAARFYTSLFPNSRIESVHRSAADNTQRAEGNGPHGRLHARCGGRTSPSTAGRSSRFNEAISLSIDCDDQAEVDRYWDALLKNGGEPSVWLAQGPLRLVVAVIPRRCPGA